nr:hypothetical protein BHI3_05980 [Bacteriovorax sp. HI3]
MNNDVSRITPGRGESLDYFEGLRSSIPEAAYKPVKRCPNCQSVYLTDTNCEACGRSLLYHPIGDPFSAKSLYGFKERYYESFSTFIKYFPVFENKTGNEAKSYVRKLMKRFDDLLEAFGDEEAMDTKNRRLFYVEIMELMDELLRYGTSPVILQQKIEGSSFETGSLLSEQLLLYLNETKKENKLEASWGVRFLNHRWFGLKVDRIFKTVIIAATVVAMAVAYYGVISSQVGR